MNSLKIVTFNFRCQWATELDGINSGIHRLGSIINKIDDEKPDVIAFQEITQESLSMLERVLPDYIFVGLLRNADYTGEGVFTALKKDTIHLIGLDTFWISPTPHTPATRFEGQSQFSRVCCSVTIRHKASGERMRIYNIHLDHIGDLARIEGIKCVMNIAKEDMQKSKLPLVLLGDFNAYPDSETIQFCDSYKDIPLFDVTKDIKTTFHNFGTEDNCKIDYIYVSEELNKKVENAEIWDNVHSGIYLSDHYPVAMELVF